MIGALREKANVRADGDEQTADIDVMLGEILVADEDAGRLSTGANTRDGAVNRLEHVRVGRPAEKAEVSRQIPGPDEDAVDASTAAIASTLARAARVSICTSTQSSASHRL